MTSRTVTSPTIRFFATTNDSYVGKCARGYLKALLRLAPVRLVSVNGPFAVDESDPWSPFAPLFATPLGDSFVNVVCCDAYRWAWEQTYSMPNVAPDGTVTSFTKAATSVQLYTEGVRNVLMLASGTPPTAPALARVIATARRYEAVVAPTEQIAGQWRIHDIRPTIIQVPFPDLDALRSVVLPTP